MNNFRWVVPIVRLFGILFLVFGVPSLIAGSITVFTELAQSSGTVGGRSNISWAVSYLVHPCMQIAIGGVLFVRAHHIAKFVTRGVHPDGCCPRCGYNLAAANLKQCPECGHADA